ncbi:putative glutamate--tRNA ligase, cytoplasmic [Fulvia fulva]|uniref:glutamate--tRNA ligase n=1 Tax=Passalora fulva TaxID=5499 RepID=A0A9Q8LJ84_PASFU|nr:putative glutamate--tRNA ligase, cytoplasmic [Fulvia fulva]KAK4622576.1 putative glutamate--tRNA ligase, cytoplasmic [Fulvia fulva]UJO18517.1 putative glutamate--tRNA ligase, cytoplasmic [Fulvia fulva]WPV16522.1 putative glutamate--tRNA ligase, cytoplasmic [Fulvia fulva]WPV31215.1 putative glutamate--tRNA ligase, cytoplasmic [Fulvia fulva]
MAEAQVKEWQERAEALKPLNLKQIEGPLGELNDHLTLRSYIVGYSLTDADTTVWKTLRSNRVAHAYIKHNLMVNLSRWFSFIEETAQPTIDLPTRPKETADEGANYDIGLPDVEKGVVTRFPPEPSGYLHIGHAKAALLNDYFAHKKYNGKMIVRFDDTNPSKEKQEFEDSILKDCELLGVKPDQVTYTSDYFEDLHKQAVEMIKAGNAYADNTPQEQLREERMQRIESSHRNDSIDDNLAHFEEMKKGTEEGTKWYIRAKIDMSSNNGAMRDPVIYRCNPEAHHRTGTTWKIYPTYDFACPIVDSVEGITHALRTTEYNDRDPQYQWFLKTLNLRHVYNWNFSRMNFIKTFLSKRKLNKVVNEGKVWGWDDPRMPTVRGIRRRGMTIPALQEFIVKQGPSKNINLMDWTNFWATNKKYIDNTAKRYTAVTTKDKVTCTVAGAPEAPRTDEKPVHAKNAELGSKKVVFSKTIILDQEDARSFEEGEEITLMNWGNAIVRKKKHGLNPLNLVKSEEDKSVTELELELHLQGDVKKTSKKVTWLSTDQELVPITLYDFDYLITKDKLEEDDSLEAALNPNTEFKTESLADCNVAELKEDDIIQFDRKGFFRIDKPFKHGESAVAFQIPTGKKM